MKKNIQSQFTFFNNITIFFRCKLVLVIIMFFDVKLLYWMNEWMNEWMNWCGETLLSCSLGTLESTEQKLYDTHEGSTKCEF